MNLIVKTSNQPIVIECEEDVPEATSASISLYTSKKEYQHWSLSDIEIDSNVITLPVTQSETKAYPTGRAFISVKLMHDGLTVFDDVAPVYIRAWHDETELT